MCIHVVKVERPFLVSVRRPLPYCTWQNGAWRAKSTKFKTWELTFSLGGEFTYAGVDMFELYTCT